jgi:dGTPase
LKIEIEIYMTWKNLLSASRPGKKGNTPELSRSAFEQDYDRIIFSHPFRRLQDKTQVHPLPEFDFVHTRLTHSLEVSSVARSLGRKTGDVIVQRHKDLQNLVSMFDLGAVTAAAALAHDLGNPPFGHAGEAALADFFSEHPDGKKYQERVSPEEWQDLIRFEGNAQGFRMLNSNSFGLTLTYATLGAFTKYPCSSSISPEKGRKSQKKFGFYQSEKAVFNEVATELGLISLKNDAWNRHPLAFLVEAADDICYSIIDLEDGCRLGLVSYAETVDLLAPILGTDYNRSKLEKLSSQNERIGILRAMSINKLVEQCTGVFLDVEEQILDGTFDKALTDQCESKDFLDRISKSSIEKIYRSRQVVEIEASGHEVLPGLLHEFILAGQYLMEKRAGSRSSIPRKYFNISLLLPQEIQSQVEQSPSCYAMLRIILDHVSGLTDKHALAIFRRMKGITV